MPIVQRAVALIEDGQTIGEARLAELDVARAQMADSIADFEWRTERRMKRWMKRLRTSPFAKQVETMPQHLAEGLDGLLDRVGLMRKARHEQLLARVRRRAKKGKAQPVAL
jgi:hypothetical protein